MAAAQAGEACYIHVVAVASTVLELIDHADSFIFVHARIPWYVLATAMVDMVTYVLGTPAESERAQVRISIFERFLAQASVVKSWPCIKNCTSAFRHYYAQAMTFRLSWLQSQAASVGEGAV
jgi:hypothetical protein